jgi:hypothetical protein
MPIFSRDAQLSELAVGAEITCPYCWESIEILIDLSVESQRYVEDCHVCCRPIIISYQSIDGQLTEIAAEMENE